MLIDEIDTIGNSNWINSLSDRKLKELAFHDADRDESRVQESKATDTFEKFYGNKKYYKATKRSTDYVERWIKEECAGGIFRLCLWKRI